jgi:hypothetical protein
MKGKGKYATRSANLEARLRDELVDKLRAENERLERELAEALAQLENERRERGSLIIDRAKQLKDQTIGGVLRDIDDQRLARDIEAVRTFVPLAVSVNTKMNQKKLDAALDGNRHFRRRMNRAMESESMKKDIAKIISEDEAQTPPHRPGEVLTNDYNYIPPLNLLVESGEVEQC